MKLAPALLLITVQIITMSICTVLATVSIQNWPGQTVYMVIIWTVHSGSASDEIGHDVVLSLIYTQYSRLLHCYIMYNIQ